LRRRCLQPWQNQATIKLIIPLHETAIDSYCYHRFFGEVYPQQSAPLRNMTLEEFLRRAHELVSCI